MCIQNSIINLIDINVTDGFDLKMQFILINIMLQINLDMNQSS